MTAKLGFFILYVASSMLFLSVVGGSESDTSLDVWQRIPPPTDVIAPGYLLPPGSSHRHCLHSSRLAGASSTPLSVLRISWLRQPIRRKYSLILYRPDSINSTYPSGPVSMVAHLLLDLGSFGGAEFIATGHGIMNVDFNAYTFIFIGTQHLHCWIAARGSWWSRPMESHSSQRSDSLSSRKKLLAPQRHYLSRYVDHQPIFLHPQSHRGGGI